MRKRVDKPSEQIATPLPGSIARLSTPRPRNLQMVVVGAGLRLDHPFDGAWPVLTQRHRRGWGWGWGRGRERQHDLRYHR